MKFPSNPKYQETLRNAKTPGVAFRLARTRTVKIRSDWDDVKIDVMYKAL